MVRKVLEVKNLEVSFEVEDGIVNAVRGIDYCINEGEVLAIVGESGSGKSVATKAITKLFQGDNGRITNGSVVFFGEDLVNKNEKEFTKIRGKDIAMIFQDPMTSLNPTMQVGKQIMEPLMIHKSMNKKDAKVKAIEILDLVGIKNAELRFKDYPHEFSGGQRQRIGIARALSVEPELIIADEPISALDVSIQAQIINIIKKLQKERETTLLFIAHDLSMVKYVSDRIAVMHKGKIVEIASAERLYQNPLHNYTKSLISSIPQPDPIYEKERVREIYNDKFDNDSECKLRKIENDHYVLTSLNVAEM
ncbi:TPA: ABC transporter ATP-binding protein [Staphylococcus aureus]